MRSSLRVEAKGAGGGGAAAVMAARRCAAAAGGACVSACIPSADGATTYRDVGYRSPPGTEEEVPEALV
jgi:hypothetical protein